MALRESQARSLGHPAGAKRSEEATVVEDVLEQRLLRVSPSLVHRKLKESGREGALGGHREQARDYIF